MPDPLSIAAGVVGLLTACAQITSFLVRLIEGSCHAPRQACIVLADVNDIQRILFQLQSFLFNVKTVDNSRAALIQLEQVVVTITDGVLLFSRLDFLLDDLRSSPVTILDRLKWAKKASAINKGIQRLQTHKSTLSLMLTIYDRFTHSNTIDSS